MFETIILKYEKLRNLIDQFDEAIRKIEELVKVTSDSGTAAVTADKQSVKDALAEFAAVLVGAARSYADEQNDIRLLEVFKVTENKLKSMRNEEMLIKVKILCDELDKIGEQLIGYEVTADDRQELLEQAEQFSKLGIEQGGKQAGRKQANKVQNSVFVDASRLLSKRLDPYMKNLGRKEPLLSETYFACREKSRRYRSSGGGSGTSPADPAPDTEQ